MNRLLVNKLLLYIADQVKDRGGQISTIRLIKFLYLIDLDHFIQHDTTLTSINWVFYKYGPYFFEIGDVLRSISIDLDAEEVITPRGKGYTYQSLEPQDISKLVSFAVEQRINRVINQWAIEDTKVLLAFVYNTLPIKNGVRNQPIDFNLASAKSRNADTSISTARRIMLASQDVLAKNWDTPEEDEAWAYLSKGK